MENSTSRRCIKLYKFLPSEFLYSSGIWISTTGIINIREIFEDEISMFLWKWIMRLQWWIVLFSPPTPSEPHRHRVKYGPDYFFFRTFFWTKKWSKKIVQSYFTPSSKFFLFLRFNMADNDDSLQDFKSDPSQLIERGEQGDTFSLQFDVGVSFHWTVEVPFEI